MDYLQAARAAEDYIISARRHIHAHPELSFREKETTAFIAERLTALGIEPHTFPDYNGVWAIVRGTGAPSCKKTVALRCDIDALPITEKTGLPFASENPGVMHACGHDGHTAMLLGAAKILSEHTDRLRGDVMLLFQSAEESCCGAKYYVEHGLMNGVDAIYGCHVNADTPAGTYAMAAGPRMASADSFTITVHGKAAHGSTPFNGKDAVVAAASILMNLQTVVSRVNDPRDALVLTVGTIHGGTRFNIIADTVTMTGTVRTHSARVRAHAEEWMRQVIESSAAALGCTAELTYEYLAPPLYNDPALTELALACAEKVFGPGKHTELRPLLGSEDFPYYTEAGVPGIYTRIGVYSEEKGQTANLHNELFTVDEPSLLLGTALYCEFAEAYLRQ